MELLEGSEHPRGHERALLGVGAGQDVEGHGVGRVPRVEEDDVVRAPARDRLQQSLDQVPVRVYETKPSPRLDVR